jgi:hypothetical protein
MLINQHALVNSILRATSRASYMQKYIIFDFEVNDAKVTSSIYATPAGYMKTQTLAERRFKEIDALLDGPLKRGSKCGSWWEIENTNYVYPYIKIRMKRISPKEYIWNIIKDVNRSPQTIEIVIAYSELDIKDGDDKDRVSEDVKSEIMELFSIKKLNTTVLIKIVKREVHLILTILEGNVKDRTK